MAITNFRLVPFPDDCIHRVLRKLHLAEDPPGFKNATRLNPASSFFDLTRQFFCFTKNGFLSGWIFQTTTRVRPSIHLARTGVLFAWFPSRENPIARAGRFNWDAIERDRRARISEFTAFAVIILAENVGRGGAVANSEVSNSKRAAARRMASAIRTN